MASKTMDTIPTRKPPVTCPDCGQHYPKHYTRCPYCGGVLPRDARSKADRTPKTKRKELRSQKRNTAPQAPPRTNPAPTVDKRANSAHWVNPEDLQQLPSEQLQQLPPEVQAMLQSLRVPFDLPNEPTTSPSQASEPENTSPKSSPAPLEESITPSETTRSALEELEREAIDDEIEDETSESTQTKQEESPEDASPTSSEALETDRPSETLSEAEKDDPMPQSPPDTTQKPQKAPPPTKKAQETAQKPSPQQTLTMLSPEEHVTAPPPRVKIPKPLTVGEQEGRPVPHKEHKRTPTQPSSNKEHTEQAFMPPVQTADPVPAQPSAGLFSRAKSFASSFFPERLPDIMDDEDDEDNVRPISRRTPSPHPEEISQPMEELQTMERTTKLHALPTEPAEPPQTERPEPMGTRLDPSSDPNTPPSNTAYPKGGKRLASAPARSSASPSRASAPVQQNHVKDAPRAGFLTNTPWQRIATLLISLIIIAAAGFIIVTKIVPVFQVRFGGDSSASVEENTAVPTEADIVSAKAFSISPNKLTLTQAGEQRQLEISYTKSTESRPMTWASLHPEIVSVNDTGLVTAVSVGVALITVTDHKGKESTALVTCNWAVDPTLPPEGGEAPVTPTPAPETTYVPPQSLSLNYTDFTMSAGDPPVKMVVNGATEPVIWASDNLNVVNIGQDGMVYLAGRGTATLSATVHGQVLTCVVRGR